MTRPRRFGRNRLVAKSLAVAAVVTAAGLLPAASSAAALPADLTIVGHGWGHGRGMGQYGALGYAQAPWNWTWQQIISYYYSGTTLAASPVGTIPVRLSELNGVAAVSVSAAPGATLAVNGVTRGAGPLTVTRSGADQSITASSGDVTVAGPWSNGQTRSFSGAVVVKASVAQVWNVLPLDSYVAGVVPNESPASWPVAALQAQAVAARSYAVAYTGGGAVPICDTPACQFYGGDYTGAYAANSSAAVTSTAGQVIECGSDSACGSPSQVALAEYSSSTGGYSAGGAFPAVVDAGDATSSNPNHDWSAVVPTSQVESAYPAVGTLQSVTVTQRNGDGDLGGRVLTMVLVGSAGRVTVTGDQFAAALGLMSDWFAITDLAPPPGSDQGYWVVAADGSVYPYGSAPSYGSMAGTRLSAAVISMAPTGDGQGYWLAGGDGGIFSFGDARFFGSTGNLHLVAPVLDMASTPDSGGYWMVASDGGVFSFGDARFFGSTGGMRLSRPVVAIAPTGDGNGYWLVAQDGGIFAFGDAGFYGSTASIRLNAPIVGMVPTADGRGYWLVAQDGGIFAFGDAGFVGSLGGAGVGNVVSVSPTPNGAGYLLVTSTGSVYAFGNATFFGDPASTVVHWSGRAIGIFGQR